MNKDDLTRRIIVKPEEKEAIAKDLGCSLPMVTMSFNYLKNTALARAIRNEALRRGAVSYVLIPEDKAWIEEEGLIEKYQTGDSIDLSNKE